MDDQTSPKVLLVLTNLENQPEKSISVELSWFSNWNFAKKNISEFQNQELIWRWHLYSASRWNNYWLCPIERNVDKLNIKNVQLILLVCRHCNWLISEAIGLILFRQDFHQVVLSQVWFMCWKDLSFVWPTFHPPCWRKISQCDCASSEKFEWKTFKLTKISETRQ